jgi:hypothetical protein
LNTVVFKCFSEQEEIHEELIKRRKGRKLLPKQKEYLINLLTREPSEHDIIKSVYKLSQSSYYRLIRSIRNEGDEEIKVE